MLASGQYADKFKKAEEWNTLEGRVIQRGDVQGSIATYNPASWIKLVTCRPYIIFSYKVEGKRYEAKDELPPVLTMVRLFTRDLERDQKDFESIDFEESMNLSADYARKHPKKEINLKDHIAYRDGGVRLSKMDELMDSMKSTEEEQDFLRPKVMIKYRPSDPSEAITAQDEINGVKTMFQSGIVSIVVALLVTGAMFFHNWVSSGTDDLSEYEERLKSRY